MRSRLVSSPYLSGLLLWLMFSSIFLMIAMIELPLFWLLNLLLALNAASFVLYGIDKLFAVGGLYRIPEKVLWFAAFAGGPIGALLGMYIFRHKTSKLSFQFYLALVILLEVALIIFVAHTTGHFALTFPPYGK